MAKASNFARLMEAVKHPSAKSRYSTIRWAVKQAAVLEQRYPDDHGDLIADAQFFAVIGGPMFRGYDVLAETLIRRRKARAIRAVRINSPMLLLPNRRFI